MAHKMPYSLVLDGKTIFESNYLPYMKRYADEQLEEFNGFYAEIRRYRKVYAFPFYNTKRSR